MFHVKHLHDITFYRILQNKYIFQTEVSAMIIPGLNILYFPYVSERIVSL